MHRLPSFLANCASRLPPLSAVVRGHLSRDHPDDVVEYADVWKRMWRILCSVCVTCLCIQRNRATFEQEDVTIAGSVQEFWDTGVCQLRAAAKREFRRSEMKIQGARLLLSLRHLDRTPREPSPQVTSPAQPPDSQEEPALLTRLRIYQKSCTH